ncbi:hypothetical protein ONZ45_g9813 [Pleurotus djamor]|nr:hypothetical protein ONZ45_g9813 [Pleurotus djamor]
MSDNIPEDTHGAIDPKLGHSVQAEDRPEKIYPFPVPRSPPARQTSNLEPGDQVNYWRSKDIIAMDQASFYASLIATSPPLPPVLVHDLTWKIGAYVYTVNSPPGETFSERGGRVYIVLVHSCTYQFKFSLPGWEYRYKVTLKPGATEPISVSQLPKSGGERPQDDPLLPNADSSLSLRFLDDLQFSQSMQMFKNNGNETFTFPAEHNASFGLQEGDQQTGSLEGVRGVQWVFTSGSPKGGKSHTFDTLSVFSLRSHSIVEFDCETFLYAKPLGGTLVSLRRFHVDGSALMVSLMLTGNLMGLIAYSSLVDYILMAKLEIVEAALQEYDSVEKLLRAHLRRQIWGELERLNLLNPITMSTQAQVRYIIDEIVLHIVESIPSRRDLLSFGLTSSKHLSIVKPHLAHRVVRCYLDNKALWLYFIQHPEYAAYVSKLEILGSYARSGDLECVPSPHLSNSALHQTPSFETHSYALEEAERLLIQALRFMVNLEGFDWQHTIPLLSSGNPDPGECSQSEDVWTNLRDFTQIKNISFVDIHSGPKGASSCLSIFRTPTLYTLRNLTHIKMKVYYSEPNDGDIDSDNSEDEHVGETRPFRAPRVDISRLKPFLLGCSGLQVLDISIIDRPFYFSPKPGNPFTDLTSIFADAHWPLLHTIEMWDITSDPDVILSFFLRHPSLSTVQFGLSIAAEDLPENPFVFPPALEKGGELKGLTTSFLANASSISLPSATIHSMIPYISYPWPVKDLGTIVPFDWCSLPPRTPIVVPDLDRAYEEER